MNSEQTLGLLFWAKCTFTATVLAYTCKTRVTESLSVRICACWHYQEMSSSRLLSGQKEELLQVWNKLLCCILFRRSLICFLCGTDSRWKPLFTSVNSEISFLFSHTLRSFSALLCHLTWQKETSPEDKAGGEVTSSCVHRCHAFFRGQGRSLFFFWYFMNAAASQASASKCQVMICITGCDPKKI